MDEKNYQKRRLKCLYMCRGQYVCMYMEVSMLKKAHIGCCFIVKAHIPINPILF